MRLHLRRGRGIVAIAATVLSLSVALLPGTSAAESSHQSKTAADQGQAEQIPLTSRQPTRIVSKSNGLTTLELQEGKKVKLDPAAYRIWRSALEEAGGTIHKDGSVTPAPVNRTKNLVEGDCGYAWDFILPEGSLNYEIYTGFHVNDTAVYRNWTVYINGAGQTPYDETFTDSDVMSDEDWSTFDFNGTVPAADRYSSDVDPTLSYAIIWYGSICTAASGIFDDAEIT